MPCNIIHNVVYYVYEKDVAFMKISKIEGGYHFTRMYRDDANSNGVNVDHFIEHVKNMPYIQIQYGNNLPKDPTDVSGINVESIGLKITKLSIRRGYTWTQIILDCRPYGFMAVHAERLIEADMGYLGFAGIKNVGETDGTTEHVLGALWLFDFSAAQEVIEVI